MNVAIIGFGGLCWVLPGIVWLLFTFFFYLRAQKTEGVIVGYANSRKGGQKPIVEFSLPDGQKITFTESTSISGAEILLLPVILFLYFFQKQKLDKVTSPAVSVLYDPRNPQRARLNSFGTLYGVQLFLIIIGTGIAMSGIPWIRELFQPLVDLFYKIPAPIRNLF